MSFSRKQEKIGPNANDLEGYAFYFLRKSSSTKMQSLRIHLEPALQAQHTIFVSKRSTVDSILAYYDDDNEDVYDYEMDVMEGQDDTQCIHIPYGNPFYHQPPMPNLHFNIPHVPRDCSAVPEDPSRPQLSHLTGWETVRDHQVHQFLDGTFSGRIDGQLLYSPMDALLDECWQSTLPPHRETSQDVPSDIDEYEDEDDEYEPTPQFCFVEYKHGGSQPFLRLCF